MREKRGVCLTGRDAGEDISQIDWPLVFYGGERGSGVKDKIPTDSKGQVRE